MNAFYPNRFKGKVLNNSLKRDIYANAIKPKILCT